MTRLIRWTVTCATLAAFGGLASVADAKPVKLTDGQMRQVTAGSSNNNNNNIVAGGGGVVVAPTEQSNNFVVPIVQFRGLL